MLLSSSSSSPPPASHYSAKFCTHLSPPTHEQSDIFTVQHVITISAIRWGFASDPPHGVTHRRLHKLGHYLHSTVYFSYIRTDVAPCT